MKRGSVHLDWVISIGIFLVYVTSIFLLVKPTYKPVYEGEALLKILESNFKEEYYWNMTKMPLFIKLNSNLENSCLNDDKSELKTRYLKIKDTNDPPQVPYVSWVYDNLFMKEREGVTYLETNLNIQTSTKIFDFKSTLDSTNSDTKEYEIYLTESQDYTISQDPAFKPQYDCGVDNGCNPLESPSCFTYTFGVSETLTGIDESKLTYGLNILRSGAGGAYPNSREYNITLYKKNGNREEAFWSTAGNVGQPPVNIQVYVKYYKDWALNEDGTREAVTVNIRSW